MPCRVPADTSYLAFPSTEGIVKKEIKSKEIKKKTPGKKGKVHEWEPRDPMLLSARLHQAGQVYLGPAGEPRR